MFPNWGAYTDTSNKGIVQYKMVYVYISLGIPGTVLLLLLVLTMCCSESGEKLAEITGAYFTFYI